MAASTPDFTPEQEASVRQWLADLMSSQNLSMTEVDQRAELGFATTSEIMREVRSVTGRTVFRLAFTFGADPYELLGLAPPPATPLGALPGYREAEALVRRILAPNDQWVLVELRSAIFVPQLDEVTPLSLAQIAQGVIASRKRPRKRS